MATPEIKIPGLNAEIGLDFLDGEMNMYVSVLQSYVKNAHKVLDRIRFVSEKNLHDYAIAIHGLKGVSAGIGAVELSAKARKLEMMANAKDLSGILAENDDFLKNAETLVNGIKNWLQGR